MPASGRTSSSATHDVREDRLDGGAGAGRPRRPAGRDHRPGRAQDDDQRPQLGRAGVHGRPRGRARRRPGPTSIGGQAALRRRGPRTLDLRVARGQGVPARRARRRRCSCGRAAGTSSSRAMLVDGAPVSASLFDFGLYLFHNGAERCGAGAGRTSTWPSSSRTTRRGCGTRSSSTARPRSASRAASIRATVLIETILAAFEMDEILYELREHAAGLNAGRWDYLFSGIKKFRTRPGARRARIAPQLTMTVPFMRAYTELLVRTCHRRGAHAIGGMAAFIPNRRDPEVTERRDGQGPRRQGARERRRVRRDVGGAPGPRPARDRDLRRRCSAPRRTRRTGCATRWRGLGRRSCSTSPSPAARSPRPASGRTSASRSRTSTRGCAGPARPRSTTSWRTPRPPRSRARSCGTGSPARSCSTTGGLRPRRTPPSATRSWTASAAPAQGRLAEAADLLDRLVLDDDFAEFLTLRAYALLD